MIPGEWPPAPTPRELEERVARALFRDACDSGGHSNGYLPYDQQPEITQRHYEGQAKAALAVVREALAEPDEAMVSAGAAAWSNIRDIFAAMLAASPLRSGS